MIKSRKGKPEGQSLPAELIEMISKILNEAFTKQLSEGEFKIEGYSYGNELLLRVAFIDSSGARKVQFDASVDHSASKEIQDQITILIDGIGHFLNAFFQGEDSPPDQGWNEVNLEGKKLFIRENGDT